MLHKKQTVALLVPLQMKMSQKRALLVIVNIVVKLAFVTSVANMSGGILFSDVMTAVALVNFFFNYSRYEDFTYPTFCAFPVWFLQFQQGPDSWRYLHN